MRKINAAVFVVLFLTSICLAQRAPVFGRTMIFSQAQLKYSLQHGNYFTYWVDWPLSMDASLKEENINFRGLQYPDYQKIQENMKLYDLDGLLFWQAHVRFGWCSDIIDFTRRSQLRDFKLVANFSSTFDPELDAPPILQSPDFLRLNDKVIVNLHSRDWREHVKAVKEKFRSVFYFLVSVTSTGRTAPKSTMAKHCLTAKLRLFARLSAINCNFMTVLAGKTPVFGQSWNMAKKDSQLNFTEK